MTPSKEDYIKAIHSLGGAREIVGNKALSEALDVSAASVTDMNNRLLNEDLITYVPYQGVKLTDSGLLAAHKLLRKHRLWETFLYEKLDFTWDEVHAEADQLEHVSSDKLIDRLDEALGHPKRDPHGSVIPNADGSIDFDYRISLLDAIPGEEVVIREVSDRSDILQYVYDRGVVPGERFLLENIDEMEGPLKLINSDDEEVLISYKAAQHIYIELIEQS